jgi:phospholipid/cholesterol/gamma-HCH transport system permease protein
MKYHFKAFALFVGNASLKMAQDCVSILSFVGELTAASAYAVRHPRKIRWRETLYYMDMCGSDAVPIVILICLLMGIILGFQGAVQLHKFGTDIFLADLVGLSIVKELGPLMVAMITIGRAGSAFAAEIGTMKVSEEIDAMITMGFVPSRFLIMPKVIAMIVAAPFLTIFGDLAGVIGGFLVGNLQLGIPVVAYYNRTVVAITPAALVPGFTKSIVFALIIATVGCMRGFEAKSDAQGVGRAATSSVVTSILLVVIADAILTVLFSFVGL